MPVQTTWTVDHACGHSAANDLSHKSADERSGFARWLATRGCGDCWRAARAGDDADKGAWLEARRAAEREAADAWTQRYAMPPLEGTERAVAWGTRCRHILVSAAYTALVVEGELAEDDWQGVEEAARTVTRAGWWIDQRDSAPDDLPELVEAATGRDRPSENPFR
ncbi:hypothetical protein [Streptomyces sp. SID3343]|uniref:hypothetical protein n=1 Tax=Streptomyces sp. SID3343 TaxID=2690260 RepID=UPI00136CC855|nr:hypothetical protein [Streptomyces sp. SID3343]MYV98754.1 hypothetical protein [Streptomyces sp. SID3343]